MKKIILMLLLLPNIVLAEVVYTEYEEYQKGISKYFEESDTLKREEYKIYNTYIEIKDEFYQKKDNSLDENYTIDYNDYIYEEQNQLDYNENVYDYQTKCSNKDYQIQTLRLTGFSKYLKISEIEIISKDNIGYILKTIYFTGSKKALQDKELYGTTLSTLENTEIGIIFNQNINLSDLKIKIYFPNQENESSNLNIILKKDTDNITLNSNFKLIKEQDNVITITFDNEYNQFLTTNNFETSNECISYYVSKIPLYKHTKTKLISLNNYLPLNNQDNFLLNDYQIRYNYYQREKIEIVDNIYLQNSTFNLTDYIVSSTIPLEDLIIKENIDYTKSGIYNLEIYYQNTLLVQKPIAYELTKTLVIEEIKNSNSKPETIATKKNPKVSKKIKDKNKRTTKNKTTTKFILKKLNNNYQIKKDNSKNISILIISLLIIVLTIFEIILLYVKRKYY